MENYCPPLCLVKMAGYWPGSFLGVFMVLDSISANKRAKLELGQYPAILTSRLVNNPNVSWKRGLFDNGTD